MDKAISHLETNSGKKVRAGKANPSLVDGIVVDYYGTPTLISQAGNSFGSRCAYLTIQP